VRELRGSDKLGVESDRIGRSHRRVIHILQGGIMEADGLGGPGKLHDRERGVAGRDIAAVADELRHFHVQDSPAGRNIKHRRDAGHALVGALRRIHGGPDVGRGPCSGNHHSVQRQLLAVNRPDIPTRIIVLDAGVRKHEILAGFLQDNVTRRTGERECRPHGAR